MAAPSGFLAGREVNISDALANLVGLGLIMAGRRARAGARAKSTPPMATG